MTDTIRHRKPAVQNRLNSIRNRVPYDRTVRFDVTKTGIARINPLSGSMGDDRQVETAALPPFTDGSLSDSREQSHLPTRETLAEFGRTALADTDHLTTAYTVYLRDVGSRTTDRDTTAQTIMTRLEVATQTGYIIPRSVRGRFLDEFEHADEVTVTSGLCAALWDPLPSDASTCSEILRGTQSWTDEQ